MAEGGVRIGTVYVAVRPDTKNFKRDLKREVEAAADDSDAKIKPQVDRKDFQKQLKDVDFKINVDVKNVERQMADIHRRGVTAVTADVDERGFIEAREQIEGFLPDRHNVLITPDVAGLRTAFAGMTAGLTASLAGGFAKFKPKIDLGSMTHSLTDIMHSLNTGNKLPPLRMKVDIDTSSLRNLFSKIKMPPFFNDKDFPKFLQGGAGGGLPNIGGGLALIAGAAVLAAPALAVVTGLLTSLPGVIAAAGVGWGVLKLGMDGIKKAAEQLDAPLKTLKESVSGVFEKSLTPVFQQLALAMPALTEPLKGVAKSMSDVATSFVATITSTKGMATITSIIDHVSEAVTKMSPGVAKITDGFLSVADTVSSKFPKVAEWFSTAGDSFSKFVDKIVGNGELDTALGNLGDVLKGFADIGGDIFKGGFDLLKDPVFMGNVKQFVEDLRSLTNITVPALGHFFNDLAGGAADIRWIIEHMPDWMKPDAPPPVVPTGQPHPGVTEGPPVKVPVQAEADKHFLDPVTSPNAPWRDTWDSDSWMFGTSKIGEGLQKQVEDSVNDNSFVQGLHSDQWLGFLQKPFNDFTAWVGPKMSEIWNSIGPTATASADTGDAGGGIGSMLTANLGPQLQQGVTTAVQSMDLTPVGPLIGNAISAGTSTAQIDLSGLKGQITSAVSGIDLSGAMAQPMAGLKAAVDQGAAACVAAIQAMGQQMVSAMQGIDMSGTGAALIQGLIGGIQSMSGAAAAAAVAVVNNAKAAAEAAAGVHSPSTEWAALGDDLISGLVIGMDDKAASAVSSAESVASQISGAFQDGMKGLTGDSVEDATKEVESSADRMETALKAVFDKGWDIGMMPVNTAMSDLGVGGGAITAALDQGLGFGKTLASNFIFNVSSADDAIAISQNKANKQKLATIGRGSI